MKLGFLAGLNPGVVGAAVSVVAVTSVVATTVIVVNNQEEQQSQVVAIQEVQNVETKDSEISVSGFQLYEDYEMSTSDNVEHTLFFKENDTSKEYEIEVTTQKREDVTTLYNDNSINYDYAGYQTTGGTFVDIASIPAGDYELNIRTEILDQDVKAHQSALLAADFTNQELSKDIVDGFTYNFYVEASKVYLKKSTPVIMHQEVDEVTTKGSEITIEGYQLVEGYDMSSADMVEHNLFFESLTEPFEFPIPTETIKREDVTELYKDDKTNYDYAGYQVTDAYDISKIPEGTYVLKIRTQIKGEKIDEVQNATLERLTNRDLSKHSVDGFTYRFNTQSDEIHLEKSKTVAAIVQSTQSVITKGDGISIKGYQFIEYEDMSVATNVKHSIAFTNTSSGAEHLASITPRKLSYVTSDFKSHGTNYDYAGFETSGYKSMNSLANGTYELGVRTKIVATGVNKIKTVVFDSSDKTLSKDYVNGSEYHYYVKNSRVYLKKSAIALMPQHEIEVVTTLRNGIYIRGYQVFETYNMSIANNIKHELVFIDESSNLESAVTLESSKRTDITKKYPKYNSNYDYSGFKTIDTTQAGATKHLPHGTYKLHVRTTIKDQNFTSTHVGMFNEKDGTLSKENSLVSDESTPHNYHYYMKNKAIYLKKGPVDNGVPPAPVFIDTNVSVRQLWNNTKPKI